ncbi:Type 2 DNA topoisomerase 6 subunit A [Ensifer sp. M14]|uniref:DUF2399 domain-containing protein n=1 Tax=Ensifer sp. M14 TaxID=2203782 RepID=UPI000E2BC3D8|nr:DUF2399 domain-containing protein [Ensifer sp. M14]RDL51841.1 Type 2 DNA topoisomerase 6 subunit A [Ensifer sp. M14]
MKSDTIIDAIVGVTAKWAKQRKQEERNASAWLNRRDRLTRSRRVTAKNAVGMYAESAWLKASGDGALPASCRQIYYAIREAVADLTGKELNYGYFSQLLAEHVDEHDLDWDVVYDARGDFVEPHTGRRVPLGTLQVRQYLDNAECYQLPEAVPGFHLDTGFPTDGPSHRFGALLFIEKQGFDPLIKSARIAERFDIAIASTKGMSTTAMRRLAQSICGDGVPLLVMHDFDISGMVIAGTLQNDTRRFRFDREFPVIDIGLRLADIDGLGREKVAIEPKARDAHIATLRRYGATEDEIDFLVKGRERVELNAMSSPKMINFIERKLEEHGVRKVVPDQATLHLAATRAAKIARLQQVIRREQAREDIDIAIPDDLEEQVRAMLIADPTIPWDDAVVRVMGGEATKNRQGGG